MQHQIFRALVLMTLFVFSPMVIADDNEELQRELKRLQRQTIKLQMELTRLQKQLATSKSGKKDLKPAIKPTKKPIKRPKREVLKPEPNTVRTFHTSTVEVHSPNSDPESMEFYPTALVADEHVLTYIAGTPIVTSPYLGSRPAFDGSDYIVNISSINRDIRLMQQRRRLYEAYKRIGYPVPQMPIIALSGKVEPVATIGAPTFGPTTGDLTLGSSELDVAAMLNNKVEAYMSLAFDESPPDVGGQRLSNSSIDLNLGFVNIGDLDETPLYFTGGQLYVPFGRYSTSMVSAPLTMILARTKTRPFILGYKSQYETGPFVAAYGYKSDTTFGSTGVGGLNLGYVFNTGSASGEIGASAISSIDDAGGMQFTGSAPGTTFGGFSSITNGSEFVRKVPAMGAHGYVNVDRYSLTAEWVGATGRFRPQDLSFNGRGAQPQAGQVEAGVTFITFNKPASLALGYQWSREALALNLPAQRISGVFNISIWKDTVESLEYRHDINYSPTQFANGAAPVGFVNTNTLGPGGATDTLLAQIGVFF